MVTIETTDIRLQQQVEIPIGPYVQGEIPQPLVIHFQDNDGDDIDLTGFTVNLVLKDATLGDGVGTVLVGDLAVALEGKARYVWVNGDLDTPAIYKATMWVGDGTIRFASQLILFTVLTSELFIPSI